MTLVVPPTYAALDEPTAAEMNLYRDGITQIQGGAPSAGALDFCTMAQIVAQSLNNATWTSLTFTSEGIDSANGHSTVSNTSRYTAVHTGWYEVSGIYAAAFHATGMRGARLAVDGVALAGPVHLQAVAVTYATCVPIARKIPLTAGHYVELQGFQSSGGALNTAYTSGAEQSVLEVRWCHS